MLRLAVFLHYGRVSIGAAAAGLRTDWHGSQAKELRILQRPPIRKSSAVSLSPVYAGVVLWVYYRPQLLGQRVAGGGRGMKTRSAGAKFYRT